MVKLPASLKADELSVVQSYQINVHSKKPIFSGPLCPSNPASVHPVVLGTEEDFNATETLVRVKQYFWKT